MVGLFAALPHGIPDGVTPLPTPTCGVMSGFGARTPGPSAAPLPPVMPPTPPKRTPDAMIEAPDEDV